MTREELLEQMAPHNADEMHDLTPTFVEAARGMPRATVEIYLGADDSASIKASSLLMGLEELAIVPIVETETPQSIDNRVWLAGVAVNAEVALRAKLTTHLEKLLDDKSLLSSKSQGSPVEGGGYLRRKRICDEAYLLMRRLRHPELAHPDNPDDPEALHQDLFLKFPSDVKDQEIERARKSGDWTRRLTMKDLHDYIAKHADEPGTPPPRQNK